MTDEKPFEWKGAVLDTYPQIIDAALKLEGEEQEAFVKAYCARGLHARANIGYFAGYYSNKEADEIYRIFKTAHPIFGTTHPSPEEAFEMGKKMGEEVLEKKRKR